jgi:hypothetical protein
MCIASVGYVDAEDISEKTKFRWVKHPELKKTRNTKEISETWRSSFNFREENPSLDEPGLRPPQRGAIHAAAEYFT